MNSSSRTAALPPFNVATFPAVESFFLAALIASCGSTKALRRNATAVFFYAAPAAVWGMMARHTTAHISHHALLFVTRRATTRFLRAWPSSSTLNVESMFEVLERSVAEAHFSVDSLSVEPGADLTAPLGALSRVELGQRMMLIESVRAQLSGAELTELAIVSQLRPRYTNAIHDVAHGQVRMHAIERLEQVLLGAAMQVLGVPVAAIAECNAA